MSHELRTGARQLALVRVGRFHLAIDSALVESVVSGPLEITPFPCVAPHVLGAFASRSGPMPTIDLAALLDGRPAASAATTVALAAVMRVPHGSFALAIDAVAGVAPASEGHLATIERLSPLGGGIFTEVFAPPEGGPPSVVLDLDAVLRIGDLHTVVQSTTRGDGTIAVGAEMLSLVLVRAGDTVFALDARTVVHVERRTATDDRSLGHPSLRGFHLHRGHHVAVVELRAALGLAAEARADTGTHLVILEHGAGGSMAIIVDDIVAIIRAARGTIEPLTDDAPAGGPLVSGCLRDDTYGIIVMLAPEHLGEATVVFKRDAVPDAVATQRDGAAGADVNYIVYLAGGGLLASRLSEIAAVVPLPSDFVDLRRDGSAVTGIFTRFGRPVQLFDLGALMGNAPLDRVVDQPVLIVEGDGTAQGFLVEAVACLRSATPGRIPSPGRRQVGIMPRFVEMIAIASDGADRSATVLEIRQLADRTAALATADQPSAAA